MYKVTDYKGFKVPYLSSESLSSAVRQFNHGADCWCRGTRAACRGPGQLGEDQRLLCEECILCYNIGPARNEPAKCSAFADYAQSAGHTITRGGYCRKPSDNLTISVTVVGE